MTIGEATPKTVAAAPSEKMSGTSNELGIVVEKVPPDLAEKMGLKQGEGLMVKHVNDGEAGSRMGIQEGDVVLEVDGKPVSDIEELTRSRSGKGKQNYKAENTARPGRTLPCKHLVAGPDKI